jgi:hypothetical protein
MQQPPGFEENTGSVLQLNKSLYGLKQASRVWHQTLTANVFEIGCIQSQSDGALYTYHSSDGGSPVYLLLYVDDIQIASAQLSRIAALKRLLLSMFSGRNLGETDFFLQMSVQRIPSTRLIVLRQQRHIDKLADVAGVSDAWPLQVPMIPAVYRDKEGAPVTDTVAITQCRLLLGAFMHISNFTRPDVAFKAANLRYRISLDL